MLGVTWLSGLLRRRRARLAGIAAGVALAVALLASIGTFLAASKATMTRRTVAQVAVDWQVEAQPDADPAQLLQRVQQAPHVRAALPVGYALTTGLQATTGGTTQLTGPGVVLGLPAGYRSVFPRAIRDLTGAHQGVLLTQQAAANLHAASGDEIAIGRGDLLPFTVRVDGVVDLPAADTLFQHVGAPPGAQPSAPPDNVLLLPAPVWDDMTAPLVARRPDLVSHQVHVRVDHRLPPDPSAAFTTAVSEAHNLELRLAGAGRVANNLAAALDAARSDALYAQLVFLFLGVPGAVIAGLLTATVAAVGHDRRRREQALLRARGATPAVLVRLALAEAALVGVVGAALGLALAAGIGAIVFGSADFGATAASTLLWGGGAAVIGALIAAATVAVPAWRDARMLTVAEARRDIRTHVRPWWMRIGLDIWLLLAGGIVFWLTSQNGYELVLAPEGLPGISVDYWALAGPALIWGGAGLLTWRIAELVLRRGRRPIAATLALASGPLAGAVASSIIRQRRLLARGIVLVALAVAFAGSTAIFNATYRQQTRVDALLTNGADVTVTRPSGVAMTVSKAALERVQGVKHVEPLLHRFAYVGQDLQDLYGVDPRTVVDATKLQDAYFQGGTASGLMQELDRHRDAVLVSAETVKDFGLHAGDRITLRLRTASGTYAPVRFRYAGVAKEFPTAPSDSFLVANRDYVAARTGNRSADTYLIDTGGRARIAVAARVSAIVGRNAKVTDLDTTRRVVGSSLTAVDLAGLTKVELGFALALAAGATGLVLFLGFGERRRSFAILTMLGAKRRQLASFVWSEAVLVAGGGAIAGAISGLALSHMLVKVLTGVFDPAPSGLAIPWGYLALAAGVTAISTAVAAWRAVDMAARLAVAELRDL